MKRSTERFLTTHTGSLPRPDDLIRMMYAKEEGVPVDRGGAGGSACARRWPRWSRSRSRPASTSSTTARCRSRATPPTSRIGSPASAAPATPSSTRTSPSFPSLAKRVFGDPGRSRRKTPACNAPISVRDAEAARTDVDNLKAAVAGTKAAEAFMSAASPGVVSLFFRNDHYKDHETYLYAIAEAMRHEYETVAKAGIVLQIDCPDLGMGRHIQYADLTSRSSASARSMHVEALNHAVANIPPEQLRMHLCWGNYEGPHHCDVPLADIIDIVFLARAARHLARSRQPAPRPRMDACSRRVKLPDGKVLIPGVIESKSNFIEHPELIAQRIGRYAKLVGRENVIAGSDCGYGTWVGQAAVDPDVVWAKIAAMAEGARIATKQFWK